MKAGGLCFVSALVTSAASAWGPSAWGQAAPEPTSVEESSTATPADIETVTVTARRRAEDGQQVPMAISTLDGVALDAERISQVYDLQQLLPSLNAAYLHARSTSLSIRGIGNNPANEGLEGSVGVYLDNVYLGRPGMAVQDLLDLERIELLRGPQGTLFGKNTTAGVLNLQTRAPGFTSEARVEAAYGERDTQQFRGILSGPLGRQWAGRLLLSTTRDEGWVRNLHDGRDLDGLDRRGARGQLLFRDDDGLQLRLIADVAGEDDSQGTALITGIGPAKPGFRNARDAAAATGGELVEDPDDLDTAIDGPQRMTVDQGGASAELSLPVGTHTLTAISAWRYWDFAADNDVDYSSASIIANYGFDVRDRQWSQEIRLASPLGERVDYVLGAYYFRQRIDNELLILTGDAADAALLPVTIADAGLKVFDDTRSISRGNALTRSTALFAQANLHLTDRIDLTAGVRGTYEDKTGRARRLEPEAAMRYPEGSPLRAAQDAQNAPWDSDDQGGLERHDFSPSGLLTLSWRTADGRHLWYATAAQGEKSGGFNINGVGSGPALGVGSLEVKPERARNYELGLKSAPWPFVNVNLNVFLTRVSHYQASGYATPPGQSIPVTVLANVGSIGSRGVEWDVRARPARSVTLTFNGAWNDAHYRSFDNAPCPAETNPDDPASCDLGGEQVQGAAKWIVNAGIAHEHRWNARERQQSRLGYAWRSSVNGSIDNSTYNEIPSYGLLNASTQWSREVEYGELAFSLWARNLLDERYLLSGGSAINALYFGVPGAPRTIGAAVSYAFR